MKKGTIEFWYYEKGDYVRTPEGMAMVVEDESPIESETDLMYSDIKVQHKHGCSRNPSNSVIKMERQSLIRSDVDEYILE